MSSNRIEMNDKYIVIDLKENIELIMHDCSPWDIGIQNGKLHIDYNTYDVRFEPTFSHSPCEELLSINIELREETLSRSEMLDKIRNHAEDNTLVNQLKRNNKSVSNMTDFLKNNKDF